MIRLVVVISRMKASLFSELRQFPVPVVVVAVSRARDEQMISETSVADLVCASGLRDPMSICRNFRCLRV